MRHSLMRVGPLVAIAALSLGTAALAEDIPILVLRDWFFQHNAGWQSLRKGDYRKAEERFNLAIKEIRPYQKRDQRLLARSYRDLARALYHQRRYAEAEPLAKWALDVCEANPKSNPDSIFQCLFTLAQIHRAQEHLGKAEPLLKRALALQEKALGADHVNLAITLEALADVYRDMRKYREAERLYRRLISIQERHNPRTNLELADTLLQFAVVLRQTNREAEAEDAQARAQEIRDNVATLNDRARADQPTTEFQGFK